MKNVNLTIIFQPTNEVRFTVLPFLDLEMTDTLNLYWDRGKMFHI